MHMWHRRIMITAALALAASAGGGCMRRGSGVEMRQGRTAAPFTEVAAAGAYQVNVTVGPDTSVEVVGDDNIVPLVETEVTGDRLDIRTEANIFPKLDLVVNVTTPTLRRVGSAGAVDIGVDGLEGDEFALDASGASDVRLVGEVGTAELALSGAGTVDAAGLKAQTVRVQLSGAGSADVHAIERLVADVSGAGSVRYDGDPVEVEKHVSGAGSVSHR